MEKNCASKIKVLANKSEQEMRKKEVVKEKKAEEKKKSAKKRLRPKAERYFKNVLRPVIKEIAKKGDRSCTFDEDDYHEILDRYEKAREDDNMNEDDDLNIFFEIVIETLKKEGFEAKGKWHSYESIDASGYGSDWHSCYQIYIQW